MAKFFTSPKDLARWVKESNSSYQEASQKIMVALESNKNEQDIIETTKRIFSNNNSEEASKVLFDVLANYNITEGNIKQAGEKFDKAITASVLEKYKVITADEKNKIVKEAQIMRQPGEYPMPLRRCPKLPYSVGKGLISTYNCRHYCLDSLVFDEDPERVYCAEALWRGHVMDKFSREWQDAKTGELVGGYINNRFYVFPDGGTPDNPDVPRYHGNRMSLKPWERSRIPRKHEWSVERRLQEKREPDSTKSITLSSVITSCTNMIKLASSDKINKEKVAEIFSESINLNNSGIKQEDAVLQLSEKYIYPIEQVVAIQTIALKKMSIHQADVYKTAQYEQPIFFTLPEGTITKAMVVRNGVAKQETIGNGVLLKPQGVNPNEMVTKNTLVNNAETYGIYNTPTDASPIALAHIDKNIVSGLQPFSESYWNDIQQGAKETGLIEENKDAVANEVPLPGKENPVSPVMVETEPKQASTIGTRMRIIKISQEEPKMVNVKWKYNKKTGEYWHQAQEGYNPRHGNLTNLAPTGRNTVITKNDPANFPDPNVNNPDPDLQDEARQRTMIEI